MDAERKRKKRQHDRKRFEDVEDRIAQQRGGMGDNYNDQVYEQRECLPEARR